MAKKRAQKRKSEKKVDQSEDQQEEVTTNGDSASISTNKKRKSGIKTETLNNTPVSASKKKGNAKPKSEEDTTDYEVLKIVDVRYTKTSKREFLIRWKNYSPKQDSWEPEENLCCDELIAKFLEDEDKRSKEPTKQLRKKPSKVQLYASPGSRRSKRTTGGNQKNYVEDEDGDE